jgi:hypothetical protein
MSSVAAALDHARLVQHHIVGVAELHARIELEQHAEDLAERSGTKPVVRSSSTRMTSRAAETNP